MMRKGEPLGNLNWKTERIFLMTSVDKETLKQFREKTEHSQQNKQDEHICYNGTACIEGKSDACNICSIPLQAGEKISCELHVICKYVTPDCFTFNPEFQCDLDTRKKRTHPRKQGAEQG